MINRAERKTVDADYLTAYPKAVIYQIESGLKAVEYTDTEYYHITRQFLINPQKVLDILLDKKPTKCIYKNSD